MRSHIAVGTMPAYWIILQLLVLGEQETCVISNTCPVTWLRQPTTALGKVTWRARDRLPGSRDAQGHVTILCDRKKVPPSPSTAWSETISRAECQIISMREITIKYLQLLSIIGRVRAGGRDGIPMSFISRAGIPGMYWKTARECIYIKLIKALKLIKAY